MFWGKVNRVSQHTKSLYRPQLEPLVYTCRTLGLLPWLGLFQVYKRDAFGMSGNNFYPLRVQREH